jgi:hypothetical protein
MCTLIRTGRNRGDACREVNPTHITGMAQGLLEQGIGGPDSRPPQRHSTPHEGRAIPRIGDCIVCGDQYSSRGIICSAEAHRLCKKCLAGYVEHQVQVLKDGSTDKFRELTNKGGRLACAERACNGILHTDAMFHLIEWGLLGTLAAWAAKAHIARQVGEGLNLGTNGEGALGALFPNALMCPKCLTGPVLAAYCDDMEAHHGQLFAGCSAPVDNSCKHCGWFGATKQQWVPWDQVIRLAGRQED